MQSDLPTSSKDYRFFSVTGRAYPNHLTGYDLLKSLALILMVIDHIGYFFLPDELWLRVIGRLSVPVWFYLIGYARARHVPFLWWGGAFFLFGVSAFSGGYLFPVSILMTLAISRIFIDSIALRALRTRQTLAGMFFLLFLFGFHTSALAEYGTIGILFVIWGYIDRHKSFIDKMAVAVFKVSSIGAYVLQQVIFMGGITAIQFWFFMGGMGLLALIFYVFNRYTLPKNLFRNSFFVPFSFCLKALGRYTLIFYVAHLTLFTVIAMYFSPERFGFMDFQLFAPVFQGLYN